MNIIHYHSTFAPVYYLRGARLPIFNLDAEESGRCEAILLQRDDNCALLPIDSLYKAIDGQPYHTSVDQQTKNLTLADLQRDGWEIFGRITITKHKA